jgi:hypothetical protein
MELISVEERASNAQANVSPAYQHPNVFSVKDNLSFIMANAMKIAHSEHTHHQPAVKIAHYHTVKNVNNKMG